MSKDLEANPWKTTGTRLIYKNPWIRVREDSVIQPSGAAGIYGVVETRTATGVVALTDQNEIYLVGQYRYPIQQYSWEIIEGGADKGESALHAIQRELREEAGLMATEWHQLGPVVHLSNCFSAEEGVFFLAHGLSEVEAEPEDTEVLQVKKVPFIDALRMVHEGSITDAMSIIGIYRAHEWLRQSGRL